MEDVMNKLVYSMFLKNRLSECSTGELLTLVRQYPGFSTGRLLLAKKIKESKDNALADQLQAVSLYISNPLWVDYLLEKNTTHMKPAVDETKPAPVKLQYEDAANDEIVVANTRPQISTVQIGEPGNKEQAMDIVSDTAVKPDAPKQDFLFEPYHTVDYFASQGIKPVVDEKPSDRFGQQLKSFTEWLKTLKRRPAEVSVTGSAPLSEEKIVTLAVHSIEDREVVTETMAEVWIKQGEPDKAVAIYRKLSLLDPSKSSYFAGLIEKIKDELI